MGSLPPESLATILFGNVFGSLRWTYDYWGPDWHSLAEGTWTDRATNYLFAGTIPALLLLWHGDRRRAALRPRVPLLPGLRRRWRSSTRSGATRRCFEFVFDHVPGVELYRRPADATFLVNIALAFAAGYLVHRYARGRIAALAGLSVCGWPSTSLSPVCGRRSPRPSSRARLRGQRRPGAPALRDIALRPRYGRSRDGLLAQAASRRPQARGRAGALVAVTGGELIWRNAASPLNAEPAERYAVFQQLPPEQLQGLQVLKQELAERNAKGERPRVEILGLGGAWQNASMVLGLEDTIGYNPLRLADYERAVGPGENAVDPNLRQFPGTFRGYKCRLANLLGLEYLVLDRPIERLPRHFPRLTGTKLLYGSGQMWIYRLNATSPRAYLATPRDPVDSEAVLDQDELPEFDRPNEALIDEQSIESLDTELFAADATAGQAARPTVARRGSSSYQPQRGDGRGRDRPRRRPGPARHLLSRLGSAGGRRMRRPLLRANLLFRGVEVPPGRHRVEFRFRPLSLDNLVAAACRSRDRRRRTRPRRSPAATVE